MSIGYKLSLAELSEVNKFIESLVSIDTSDLLLSLAIEGENQTRRRLSEEKKAPDNSAWPEWSFKYLLTRHQGHSLLMSSGGLLDSITSDADTHTAIWGSNKVYAATHQFGDAARNIPKREYLGLSDENFADMQAIANDWIESVIQ